MTPAHIVVLLFTLVTVVLLVMVERRSRRNLAADATGKTERAQFDGASGTDRRP